MATRKQVKATEGITAVIESPVQEPVKAKAERYCICGCGRTTKSKFAPGHDATLKSQLLGRVDAGDADAEIELISRNWYTPERLERRALKRSERQVVRAEKAERAAAAKAEKADRAAAKAARPAKTAKAVSDAAV